MEEKKRGGARVGAGRKKTGREYTVTVRLSLAGYMIYRQMRNKSKKIDELLKKYCK